MKAFKLNAISVLLFCSFILFYLFFSFFHSFCYFIVFVYQYTHIPYVALCLFFSLLIHRKIYRMKKKSFEKKRKEKIQWKKIYFIFIHLRMKWMGILVFKSTENQVFLLLKKETSSSWPNFEMHAHWITCACACIWMHDENEVGGPQVVNESMRTRANLSKFLCTDIFLIWFDVNKCICCCVS